MHRIRAQLFSHNNSPNHGKMNDECALVGRHGRAHRHRPYPSPSYFSTQSHTNQITIYMQSIPTKPTVRAQSTQTNSTVPRAIWPNETVGAVPVCPPERSRSGVSIPKIHALYAGYLTADAPLQGDTGGHTGPPLPTSSYFSTQSHANKITIYAQPTPTAPTIHAQSAQTKSTAHAQSLKRH